MASFEIAHSRTANFEGGYQADKDDKGNYYNGILIGTNYGITAPELAAYLKRTPTAGDMKNLSKEVAKEIYRKNYWSPIRGDEINNQDEANAIYDMGINAGVGTAINLCQRTLGLPETAVMTTTTINKLNNKA